MGPAARNPQARVQRILGPTDFSPGADVALAWAVDLCEAYGAELTILHVMDFGLAGAASLPTGMAAATAYGQMVDALRREAGEGMVRVAKAYPQARRLVREGTPRSVILEAAQELRSSLIVIGTHGRTGLAHIFFGSVAEYVVRHSPIPVLTVRQEHG